ncbi:MAG: GGDEF domain-containing protein [Burkholderiaceae bacterium]
MATPNPTPTSTRESAAINTVARETLRRIAQARISPTPEAYARIYREVSATHPDHPPPAAIDDGDSRVGASLINRLLAQIDAHHAGITVTKKREGLKRALLPRAEPLPALFARINRLMESWNGPNAETGLNVSQFLGTDILGGNHSSEYAHGHVNAAASVSHAAIPSILSPNSSSTISRIDAAHLPARALPAASELPERVISMRLAGLLALLLKNIADLTPDSGLLGNQIEQIGRVLTAPLTEKKLDEAERCLRALIVRQGAIKHSMDETKRAIRDLAETLLERLSGLVNSTDCYSTRMFDMAEQIASADNLTQLSNLTQMLVADARLMSSNVAAEHSLLAEAQSRVQVLQERTQTLENELREASTLVRTDPLTRAMNRRGFGDAFAAEMVDADGGVMPSIALIDVDDFKCINEQFGHSVGDEVLCSLVEVLHQCAQPANIVARYGGEEFALMFPRTTVDEAERAVLKMQRALLDRMISNETHRPLITFSAGVAQVDGGEALGHVMTRADRALRQAKQAGKNCIVIAPVAEARAA